MNVFSWQVILKRGFLRNGVLQEKILTFNGDIDVNLTVRPFSSVESFSCKLYNLPAVDWVNKVISEVPDGSAGEYYDVEFLFGINGKKNTLYKGFVSTADSKTRSGAESFATIESFSTASLANVMATTDFNEGTPLIDIIEKFANANNLEIGEIDPLVVGFITENRASFKGNGIKDFERILNSKNGGFVIENKKLNVFLKQNTPPVKHTIRHINNMSNRANRPVIDYFPDFHISLNDGVELALSDEEYKMRNGVYRAIGRIFSGNLYHINKFNVRSQIELFKDE